MLRAVGICSVFACALIAGCSGSASSSSSNPPPAPTPTPTPTPSPSPGNGSGAVTVVAGANVTGVNITVKPPTSSPPANVTVLGVVQPGSSSGSAFGTGDTITRGTTAIALVFGPGLNGSQKVTVAGPPDITVGSVRAISATDKTPGLQFALTVSPTAALGARSVYITSTNGDITGFVGGLEVTP